MCNKRLQQCARAPSVKLVKLVNRHAPAPPARMRPARAACRACSSFRACTACRALRGRGLRLRVCGRGLRLRVCGLRARVRCLRACGFACVRRAACGCGVGVRAAARVRSRCSSRQLHFLRRAFGSGRVSDVEVREFVGVRKSRFTKSTSSKSSKGSKVKVVKF